MQRIHRYIGRIPRFYSIQQLSYPTSTQHSPTRAEVYLTVNII